MAPRPAARTDGCRPSRRRPWDGEYPALIYGANCPQRLHTWAPEQTFLFQWTDGWQSEDMLKVNIWTSSLTGSRPVMVYLHGGGFTFGSAYELASQDGAQMARHHDVVSVTVNHRLNILGFLDLSEFGGPAYADSANVGMTDLVAALQWVRNNIANFGGDPDRVMIYGQSGGGSKVTTLLGMPSAQGLIHRASAQSGGGGNPPSAEQSRELTKRLVAELGVKDMAGAAEDGLGPAERRRQRRGRGDEPAAGPGGRPDPACRDRRRASASGRPSTAGSSRCASFFEGAPDLAKNVPMLIGSVSEEGNRMSSRPTEAEWMATLDEELRRRQGGGDRGGAQARLPEQERPHAVVHVQRTRPERPRHAQQRHADGDDEARTRRARRPTRGTSGGSRRCWRTPEPGTPPNSRSASTTPPAARRAPATVLRRRRWRRRWRRRGRTSRAPAIRASPACRGRRSRPDRCPTMVFDNPCRMVDDPDRRRAPFCWADTALSGTAMKKPKRSRVFQVSCFRLRNSAATGSTSRWIRRKSEPSFADGAALKCAGRIDSNSAVRERTPAHRRSPQRRDHRSHARARPGSGLRSTTPQDGKRAGSRRSLAERSPCSRAAARAPVPGANSASTCSGASPHSTPTGARITGRSQPMTDGESTRSVGSNRTPRDTCMRSISRSRVCCHSVRQTPLEPREVISQQILIHGIDVDGLSKLVRERERAVLHFRIGMPTCSDESNEAHEHVLSAVLFRLRPFDAASLTDERE